MRERERERERERQTGQINKTDTERGVGSKRERDRQTDRQTDREGVGEREREAWRVELGLRERA